MTPEPSSSTELVPVLFILGSGRSGSTILGNILGSVDGFFFVGELHHLWERGLLQGRRCGCGVPVPECPTWRRILDRAFGPSAYDRAFIERVASWKASSLRIRNTRRVLRSNDSTSGDGALRAYSEVAGHLYEAIAEITGAKMIVESSKRPVLGAFLRGLPGVQPRFVHLVRDPRAVAYSWRRAKPVPDGVLRPKMGSQTPIRAATDWVVWNAAATAVTARPPSPPAFGMRYEDFAEAPRAWTRRVIEWTGQSSSTLPFADERTALVSVTHTVAGNPGRFATGSVPLHVDAEWMTGQRTLDRAIVTAIAYPWLRRYGYSVRPSRAVPAGEAVLEARGARSGR